MSKFYSFPAVWPPAQELNMNISIPNIKAQLKKYLLEVVVPENINEAVFPYCILIYPTRLTVSIPSNNNTSHFRE